ncbi:MAG TPA: hypothetical protein VI754_11400 [Bacteriovoracaceae bacterium]|nr:hypothetical protein [Bacteriovoracaceae bacterium]
MGIVAAVAYKIRDANNQADIDGIVNQLVEDRYKAIGDRLNLAQREFGERWSLLISPFSEVVTATTQQSWFYNQYICVISLFHPGLSNWYGNKVAIKYDQIYKHRILAHEIVLSHVFQVFRKFYTKDEMDDWHVWAFSEITAVLILDDSKLKKFWPDFPTAGDYFTHSNYPQLATLETELLSLFSNRQSFSNYVAQSFDVLKKFEHLHHP